MRLALEDVSENKYMKELINILNGGDLPFDLPSYINWPSSDKKRAQSERAIKLLLAGVEYFRNKYPLNEVDNKNDEIKIVQKTPAKEQTFENPFG